MQLKLIQPYLMILDESLLCIPTLKLLGCHLAIGNKSWLSPLKFSNAWDFIGILELIFLWEITGTATRCA